MWISHHKRILLWHTARNILAIFYMLQIGVVSSCGTEFDDVQSKAILSPIVIVGRITRLELILPAPSTDYKIYTAVVQVLSVLKQPRNLSNDELIYRKQHITVDGFLTNLETGPTSLSSRSPAQSLSLTSSASGLSQNRYCLSYVNQSEDYILFINRTSNSHHNQDRRPTYHTAQLSSKYTKTDKKLIKDVICADCEKVPNAKSKRNLQTNEGAVNYKINCRVVGNPPPDIRWFKDDKELDNSVRGIIIKQRRKRSMNTVTIRIKAVKVEHAGTYRCIAKNILGQDIAKTKLKVVPKPKEDAIPPPPDSGIWDSWASSIESESKETTDPEPSHYISCTGRDRNYCLHGGECKVFPDGRYKHCRCVARFTGTRCAERNIIPPTAPIIQSTPGTVYEKEQLVSAIIALATVLAMVFILLLILAFYCAGWRYRSQREKRLDRHTQYAQPSETVHLFDEVDSKFRGRPTILCQTMATQTEPAETSLQQLRRSLNLENHFPHSSSGVVLRRKSSDMPARPSSQPGRTPRSRLSATSTITENRKVNDSEFNILPEGMPSSASLELDITRSVSSCGDKPHPQANCDLESPRTNSLYISESTTDSEDSDQSRSAKTGKPHQAKPHHVIMLHQPNTNDKHNASKYQLREYNGNV